MVTKLQIIQNALTSIPDLKVFHYFHTQIEAPYCIWAEDSEYGSLWASNHKQEQVISGTIDYFTRLEFDENIDRIQEALNSLENVGWSLNSVQFEDETNLIHYEWVFSIA